MVITLSREQQTKLLLWARQITASHVDDDCMPPSYTLEIEIGGGLEDVACARCGSSRIELGAVDIQLG